MDSTGKSLVVLSALTVAALTWFVGERFIAGSGNSASNGASSATEQSMGNAAETAADLNTAKTAEQSDAAKLQALLRGQNAAALALAKAAALNADNALDSAFADEFSQAYDAIYNKTDSLFKNPKTNPNINVYTQSADIQATINAKRQQIGGLLASWKPSYAPIIAAYLTQLESIVGALTPENSGLTQSQINAYQASVVAAVTQVNNAISNVASAQAAANLANDEVAIQEAAGNPDAIAAAEQAVSNDQSNVAALEAELAAEQAAAAAAGNDTGSTATDNGTDNTGNGNSNGNGNGNSGNNPGSVPYGNYESSYVQAQQAQFQQILKNNPPELLNF